MVGEIPVSGCGRNLTSDHVYYVIPGQPLGHNDLTGNKRLKNPVVDKVIFCGSVNRLCYECAVKQGYIW